MGKIYIKNLGFDYNGVEVFDGFNVEIDSNWKVGLVGRNGKGKTTLLKIIADIYTPSKGEIDKELSVSYFPFNIKNKDDTAINVIKDMIAPFRKWEHEIELLLSRGDEEALIQYGEIEELYRAANGYEIESFIKRELKELDIDEEILDRSFSILSGGEQTKMMLLALFLRKDHYILIDEPTNHLDIYSREIVADYLKKKNGFICVSHDRYFINRVADHILSIEKSGLELSKTNYLNWEAEKALKEESEHKKNIKLKKDIKKLNQSMLEKKKWSASKEQSKIGSFDKGRVGHLAAKMMQRAKNIEGRIDKQISEKESLLKNYEKEYDLKFHVAKNSVKNILTINNLTVTYGDHEVLRNFNLNLEKGDRIALIGKNGCGKSSIIKAILHHEMTSGIIHLCANAHVEYASQNFEMNFENLREHLIDESLNETEFRNILACFGVKDDIFYKTSSEFSAGERKKIQLTKSIMNEASLIIWDEPLNYLDVSTRKRLEQAILKYQPTMLFIEHDRLFVENVATQIVEL